MYWDNNKNTNKGPFYKQFLHRKSTTISCSKSTIFNFLFYEVANCKQKIDIHTFSFNLPITLSFKKEEVFNKVFKQ